MKMQNAAVFIPEIKLALQSPGQEEIPYILEYVPLADLAAIWSHFDPEERKVLFSLLEAARQVELFELLSIEDKKLFLRNQPSEQVKKILNEMSPDVRVDMFSRLSPQQAQELFSLMERDEVKDVKKLLEYPPETAGGRMTTEYTVLHGDMTARQALLKLQESLVSKEVKNVYALYCVDSIGRVAGGISLQSLVASPPEEKIEKLIHPVDNIKVRLAQDQEEVAHMFSHYNLLSAPVVDFAGRLAGVITVDDIVDVIRQEADEDIAIMSGVDPSEFKKPSLVAALKTRLPWLMLAYLGGLAAAGIIGRYEAALEEIVALAAFIPVIMHMGGTIGVQSSTVVVRGFALGKIETGRIGKILTKELITGFLLSAAYAILLGFLSHLRYGTLEGAARIGIVTGGGIGLVMLIGALTGIFLPFGFKKFGVDPAVATGPIITTLIDIAGLGVYFVIASAVLL